MRKLPLQALFLTFLLAIFALQSVAPAFAAEPVKISREDTALDLTKTTEIYRNQGNVFQVSTAAGADGIVRRIECARPTTSIRATGRSLRWPTCRTSSSTGDRRPAFPSRQFASLLARPRFAAHHLHHAVGRLRARREPSTEADVFSITLNPGAVVTFVAELSTPDLPQLYLWEPDAYKDTVNAFTLYRGIVLGIAACSR